MGYYILFGFCSTILIFLLRNELIFRHYLRAIDLSQEKGFPPPNVGHYDTLLFDLTKWTFRQCFPAIEVGDER